MTKAAFQKKRTLFPSKMDLNLSKKPVNCYTSGQSFLRRWKLDASEFRWEILGTSESFMLGKDVEDHLHRSCETLINTKCQGREEYPTNNKKKKC